MIGIFDSGLGGLLAFKEIQKVLPQYSFIYLGDNLRSPYGGKSQEVVYEYTKKAVDFLFQEGCNLVILACNTASSEALRKIQQEYLPSLNDKNKNVLGVVRPLVEVAVEKSKKKIIGVVGTKATIDSNVYEVELKKIDENIKIFQKACPLLVPLIEENYIKKPETKKILKNYLRSLKSDNIDTLILACTHYPILLKEFQRIMGRNVEVLDSNKIIADKLKDYLDKHSEIEKTLCKKQNLKYLTTDFSQGFQEVAKIIMKEDVDFQKISLD